MLRSDWAVAHEGQLYQVRTSIRATHVVVEDRLDGTRRLTHHGRSLARHAIAARPVKATQAASVPRVVRPVKPRPDHPWYRLKRLVGRQHSAAATT